MSALIRCTAGSVRRKRVILLATAIALPIVLLAVVRAGDGRALAGEDAPALLAGRVDELAGALEAFHAAHRLAAERLAGRPEVRGLTDPATGDLPLTGERTRRILREALATGTGQLGICILDPHGTVRNATEPGLEGRNYGFQAYLRQAAAGESAISDIFTTATGQAAVSCLAYAAPVWDANGKVGALVSIWVRAESIWDMVRAVEAKVPAEGWVVVVDRHCTRVAPAAASDGAHPEAVLAPACLARARAGTLDPVDDIFPVSLPRGGGTYLCAARRLQVIPWTVFCALPKGAIPVPVAGLVNRTASAGVGILIVALLIGTLATTRLLRPVRVPAAGSPAAGRSTPPVLASVKSGGEPGVPGADLDTVAAALATTRQDLERGLRERADELDWTKARLAQAECALAERTAELAFEREQVEGYRDLVRQKERDLERAGGQRARLLMNIIHEVRPPLEAMVGLSELLLVYGRTAPDPAHSSYADEILRHGRHLLTLVNGMHALARIESGRAQLSLGCVLPGPAITDARQQVGGAAQERRIVLRTDVRTTRPVRADAARLREILVNLIQNAVRTSPAAGVIDIGVEEQRGRIRFWVHDQGSGPDEKLLRRMIGPVPDAGEKAPAPHPWSCLLLALTKRLVEQHGGHLEAEWAPGAGTTLSFTVAAGDPAEMPAVGGREAVSSTAARDEATAEEMTPTEDARAVAAAGRTTPQ